MIEKPEVLRTPENDNGEYLTGKLMLAMPVMQDPRFVKSVIYMCAHNEEGAMGLVINQPLEGIDFRELIEQLDLIGDALPRQDLEVNLGGPVEPGRGFVIHSPDFRRANTMMVGPDIGVTASMDILREIAEGRGPQKKVFVLGYAGWGPGQLEGELQENAWLTMDADEAIIFDTHMMDKWDQALAKLGIDPVMLSGEAGSA